MANPVPAPVFPTLTVLQPWATLLALGAKRFETRSWSSGYRGPLAIHAGRTFDLATQELCFGEPFASVLAAAGISHPRQLPRGVVLAIGRLSACQPTVAPWLPTDPTELAFGNFGPGRYMWQLDDVAPLPTPLPARGALGLWNWQP